MIAATQQAANLLSISAAALLTWPAPGPEEKATALVLIARSMQLIAESDPDRTAGKLAEKWCRAEIERRTVPPISDTVKGGSHGD